MKQYAFATHGKCLPTPINLKKQDEEMDNS